MMDLDSSDPSLEKESDRRAASLDSGSPSESESKTESLLMMRAFRFNPAFADWTIAAMERLVSIAKIRSYSKNSWIAHQEYERSDILVIVSGFVLVSRRTPDGDLHSVGLVGPGRIVAGLCNLMWTPHADLQYVAHDHATVIHVNGDQFFSQLNTDPVLWKAVLAGVLRQRSEFVATLLEHTVGNAPQRLARLILRYAKLYGSRTRQSNGTRVPIRLSQSDLAALLQVSRQTIGETVRFFREAGWIRRDQATFTVLDESALREFSLHAGASAGQSECQFEDEDRCRGRALVDLI